MPLQKRRTAASSRGHAAPGMEERLFDAYTRIRTAQVRVTAPNGRVRRLPGTLHAFLTQLNQDLDSGKPVTIFEADAELTTAEAAGMLAVSRQFLVNLLEVGAIPFHRVGTHRRVYARDLLSFKAKRDQASRKMLDKLAQVEMSEGLYDRVPLNEGRSR